MEYIMTNEEIKIEIQKHQFELQKALTECCATFELNQNIAIHKKAIDALRHKCTHQNDNHEVYSLNQFLNYKDYICSLKFEKIKIIK